MEFKFQPTEIKFYWNTPGHSFTMRSVAFLMRGRVECVKHSHLNPDIFTVGQVCPTCRVE